jgi:REP element-mobilizing transposase RayT
MSRKLRFEYPGAIYHILNRGNYRSWIFESDGARKSFETTLFEACEYAGWKLHAFVVMSNHFHLAIETPEPNLSEGMRWLQSVFAMRFNRFRKENGHLFQGRFKSILIEDFERLSWLCHYIHLNPVRAGICSVSELRDYRYGSYWYFRNKRKSPPFLSLEASLSGAGELADTTYGRNKYDQYLEWLNESDVDKKSMHFEKMSKGWALGSKAFKADLLKEEKHMVAALKLGIGGAREARELAWERRLKACLRYLRKTAKHISQEPKSTPWKAAIACHMKTKLLCPNGWLAEVLSMGSESGVSKLANRTLTGEFKAAKQLLNKLNSRIKE